MGHEEAFATAQRNKEIVRDFYDYLKVRDIDGLIKLCADDFRWGGSTLLWDPNEMLGTRGVAPVSRSKDEFYGYLTRPNRMPYKDGILHFRIHGMTAEGDRVAVEVETYGELPTPVPYNNWFHSLFVIRDGLVRSVSGYKDTLHEQTVLGKS